MQDFLPRNQHAQMKMFQNNSSMKYGAEIVLSKSIFYVKIEEIFSKKKKHLRISIWETIFCKNHFFLTSIFEPCILKIQWFPLIILIFGQKK